jgi:hypothetical protein
MPNSSSVKRAFLETPAGRMDDGPARTDQLVLLLAETPRSSDECPDVNPGSRAVPIPGGTVPVVGHMPEACVPPGAGLLRWDVE